MLTTKQQVQKVLDQLPDDCTIEDVQYHLYVADLIRRRCDMSVYFATAGDYLKIGYSTDPIGRMPGLIPW